MRIKFVLPIVLVACHFAIAPTLAQAPAVPSNRIYITHVTVIDTETGKEAQNQTVIISGNRISDIRNSKKAKPPADARVVEGRGKYLIPGLWDMHVHAFTEGRFESMFPMFVANGVLGIRDMGTSMPLAEIDQLRKQIANGSLLGPRFVTSGPILDGHAKPMRATFLAITTPQEGRAAVRSLKASGADFVKVYSWLSRDSFLAIADEANKLNIPFGGHVPFSVSVLEASDAGMKSMEHLYGIALACATREEEIQNELVKGGADLPAQKLHYLDIEASFASYSDEKAAQVFSHLARNHAWQVPTFAAEVPDSRLFDTSITADERLRFIPPSVQKSWSKTAITQSTAGLSPWGKFMEQRLQMVGAMHRAGVPMLAGTDAAWYQPYTYAGFSLHDELTLLVRAGLTPLESLQTATLNPAHYLGLEKDLGTIAKGKLADMVLLQADPLLDISNTQKIEAVIVNGRLLERKALDSLLGDAENDVRHK
jgi:imidazolonepropionase-like amidohydrolase